MKNKIIKTEPELSRVLRVEKIAANGVVETIRTSEAERQALAERFDLIGIEDLQAKLTVTPKQTGIDRKSVV